MSENIDIMLKNAVCAGIALLFIWIIGKLNKSKMKNNQERRTFWKHIFSLEKFILSSVFGLVILYEITHFSQFMSGNYSGSTSFKTILIGLCLIIFISLGWVIVSYITENKKRE